MGDVEKALWYLAALISTAAFAYGAWRLVRRWRSGRGAAPRPRAGATVRIVLTHAWIRRRAGAAGYPHAGVFYGFLVLFAGTVILAIQDDVAEPLLGWTFWQGAFYQGYSLFLDVFGAALVVGLGVLRRPAADDAAAEADVHGGRLGVPAAAVLPRPVGVRCSRRCGSRSTGRRSRCGRRSGTPSAAGSTRPGSAPARPRRCGTSPGGCTASSRCRSSPRFPYTRRCTCWPGRPACRCATRQSEHAAGRAGGRLRDVRRLPAAAPGRPRRLHALRPLPRGVPGDGRRACRCRRATWCSTCSATARARAGARDRLRHALVVHAVHGLRRDLPGRASSTCRSSTCCGAA